jgi:hypothetical protein
VTRKTSTARSLLAAIVGILFAGALLTPSSAAAAAHSSAPRVTFGVQPATASHPDSRPNLSYGVTPGSTVRDHVAIVNFSSVPLTLSVYATDAINTTGGGFGLLRGGQRPKDAGAWTSIGGREPGGSLTVHVPARHRSGAGFVLLPVIVHVPAGAGPGDHVGGVVAVLSTVGTTQGTKVRLDQRVATRLFVRVSGPAKPRLVIDRLTATYHPGGMTLGRGTVTVTYTVRNTGNVSLGARQSVHVSGLFGAAGSTPAIADIPLLLPGASVRESVDVRGVLPLVRLSATVTLHPTHPAGAIDPGLAAQVVASVSFWAVPWALLILVFAALAAGGWWWRRRAAGSPVGRQAAVREPVEGVLTKRVAVSAALVAIAWSVVGVGTTSAMAASSAPYKDPRATSPLALCGKDGKQVTSGSTADKPFVWRAVSASKAPAPYNKKGRTATLFAYQPRPQVDAAEWSGDLMTASAKYTDASHPMAAATDLDEPLTTFLGEYPTKVDGFVQLRLYLGAPNEPALTLQYAAANIQVSQGRWHLVGTRPQVSCTSGTAVSLEAILPTPAPSASAAAKPSSGTTSTTSARPAPSVTADSTATAAAESGVDAAAGSGRVADGGNGWRISAFVAALAVLAVGGVAWWSMQRRNRAGQ